MALPSLDSLQPAGVTPVSEMPAALDAAPAAAAPAGVVVPPEVIQQLGSSPLVQMLQKGDPGAAYLQAGVVGGDAKLVESYDKLSAALPQLGLAAYHGPKSKVLVMYNPKAVTPDELAQADEKGTIGHLAIPVGGSKHGHLPVNANGEMPVDGDVADISGGLMGSQPAAAPLPADAQAAAVGARVANMTPQPPVDQPNPAGGDILNGLIKRAV